MARSANDMNTGTMKRKPILMPSSLISQVEKEAQKASKIEKRNVSFAEIVRRALGDYKPSETKDDEMLEALLDGVIKSTGDTVRLVRKLNKKLDKSYKELSRGND